MNNSLKIVNLIIFKFKLLIKNLNYLDHQKSSKVIFYVWTFYFVNIKLFSISFYF